MNFNLSIGNTRNLKWALPFLLLLAAPLFAQQAARSAPGVTDGSAESAVPAQSTTGESTKTASAGTGSISGTVKDTTGAVLVGAQITLKPTGALAAANSQGNFHISNLRPGTYEVTVSDVGFKDSVSTVTVTAGQSISVNPVMAVNGANESVVVSANLEGDVAAVNEQRTSANILNVMTAAQIQNLPNQSVATVLGRMPGVTVQINEGEPQYVQIRGTEPRLSNTTLDGVSIPGPDPMSARLIFG